MNLKLLLFSGFVLLFVGCSSKGHNVYYSDYGSTGGAYGGSGNYGTPNKNPKSHEATMRPYQINGKWYYPTTVTLGESYDGIASWYGPKFHGKKTSNGEIYSMYAHTAAHKTLPMNTIVKVTSQENGKSTIVRINDRGPFVAGRIIDLSNVAARDIDMLTTGTARVKVEVIGFDGVISDSMPLSKENLANSEYEIAHTNNSVQLSNFMVQIGAFRRKEGAEAFKNTHSNHAPYHATIREYQLNDSPIYRVMLSGFKSEEEARDFIKSNKVVGAFIVTN